MQYVRGIDRIFFSMSRGSSRLTKEVIPIKRLFCFFLAVLMLSGMGGCADNTPETTPPQTEAATLPTETAAPVIAETIAPAPEGLPWLKVSAITLSVVGETEDIYLGMVPREDVIWESDDENVATFDQGVLTATGVGSTTVRAVCGDHTVECQVGCLAETEEALLAMDNSILSQPKRIPPVVDLNTPCSTFDGAAIIGDSITYFMFQWESKGNQLGDVVFLARGGVSLNGFVKRFKNMYYRGSEMYIEEAIQASGVDRIYVMLGQNDLTSKARTIVMENWEIFLERIRETTPDVEIYIQSCIPEYAEDDSLAEKNKRIEEYNTTLRQFAGDNGCHFIDLGYYIRDHKGRMPEPYNQGNYHMNETGCLYWMQILRYYREYELNGGDLS